MVAVARAIVIASVLAACRPPPRVGAPCREQGFEPFDHVEHVHPVEPPAEGVLDGLVAWYQRHGRAPNLAGTGCPFAPSCSVYAREAFRQYGPLGLVLVFDRLIVREHPFASAYYPTTCVDHTTKLDDDVP